MPPNAIPEFDYWLLEMLEYRRLRAGVDPIYLGGSSGSAGGVGGPPGGFIGSLIQSRVSYDNSESADTSGSTSLWDNLNHIRARLSTVSPIWNRSGGSSIEGNVVSLYLSGADGYTAPSGASDLDVIGVVRSPVVSSGSQGLVTLGGYARKIDVDSSTNIGDYLYPSATPGKATPSSSGSSPGLIGRATSAGASYVSGIIYPTSRQVSGGGGGGGASLASILESHQAAINTKAVTPAGLLTRMPTTSSGSALESGFDNSVSVGSIDSITIGHRNTNDGVRSMTMGVDSSSSGSSSMALGDGARADISYTTNLGGPIIIRNDMGEADADIFRSYSGVEVVLMTDEINLKFVADKVISLPSGVRFWIDELGVVVTSLTDYSIQPSVRFGIMGSLAKHRSAAVTSGLTAANKRYKADPLVPEDGETSLSFGVTSGGSASAFYGRAYWKGLLVQDSSSGSEFSPLSIAGLDVWYDFGDLSTLFTDDARTTPVDSDGDPIGGVTDKSGNGNHASQSASGERPLYKTAIQNGRSAALFDGTDDTLNLTPPNVSTGMTVFLVLKAAVSASAYVIDSTNNNTPAIINRFDAAKLEYFTSNDRETFSVADTGWQLMSFAADAGALKGRYNGSEVFSITPVDSLIGERIATMGGASLGAGSFFDSYIGEIVIYDAFLSDADMLLVDTYLIDKWGI